MQLAGVRIPRLRLPFGGLGALGGRTMVLYVGYTAVLFVVFLLVTFPHELLVRRALTSFNQGPVEVDFASAGLAWLDGYELSGLRLSPRPPQAQTPYLEVSHVFVRPAFGELVRGNPYAFVVRVQLYGGQAYGQVNLKGGTVAGSFEWHDLGLDRYRTLTAMLEEGQLAGRVSGQFSFEARGPNFSAGQGAGEIIVDRASISSAKVNGFTVPDAKLSQTKMKFKIGGGRLEIQEFNAAGDAGIQGSGQIILRDPLPDSTLNLRATFLPNPATPDAIKIALALIPRQPGAKPDAPVTITGSLSRPKFR